MVKAIGHWNLFFLIAISLALPSVGWGQGHQSRPGAKPKPPLQKPGNPAVGGGERDYEDKSCSECEASSPEELMRCAQEAVESQELNYPWYVDAIEFACDAGTVISIGIDIITIPSGEGVIAGCFLAGVKQKVKTCVKKNMCKQMVWFEVKRRLDDAVKLAADRVAKQRALIQELERKLANAPGYAAPMLREQIHNARLVLDDLGRALTDAIHAFSAHLRTPCN